MNKTEREQCTRYFKHWHIRRSCSTWKNASWQKVWL